MIDAIELINFQSHEHTVIEPHPRVNVIKGTSHHGKSAIVRGCKWALFNRPRGEGFKSHFAKDSDPVEVSMSFAEGAWVSRVRDDQNRYLSEGLDLKALKTDVPDEIQQVTQIRDINFQSQGDPYFLIGDTPGQAGKRLNETIGLEIIDEVRNKVNRIVNQTNVEINIVDEDLGDTQYRLEGLDHVEKAEFIVSNIVKKENKRITLSDTQNKIRQLADYITANGKLIADLTKWLKVDKHYTALFHTHQELKGKEQQKDKVFWLVEEIENRELILEEIRGLIGLEPDVKNLQETQKKLIYATDLRLKLSNLYSGITQAEKSLKTASDSLMFKSQRQIKLQEQLEYCQYCGSPRKYWRK